MLKKVPGFVRGTYCGYREPTWRRDGPPKALEDLRIAVICDGFTWENMRRETNAVYLTPSNWRSRLESERPDVLFCEAAWEGLQGCWQNMIFRDCTLRQDNRFVLRQVLRYCRGANIPTVFWNKEDTPAFDDYPRSFIDTALLFDHILTTTVETIPKYRALGHPSVHLMMFGFSPELFSPLPEPTRRGTAVFFGSWYESYSERCRAMRRIFDMVLEKGLKLVIYDRMSGTPNEDRAYPEKYRPYVTGGVPYDKVREVMREAEYVININTVEDSDTMFARRVIEVMACGRLIISNESKGLRRRFPGRIWFVGETFSEENPGEIVEENIKCVFLNYTFRTLLGKALHEAGIVSGAAPPPKDAHRQPQPG